METLILKYRQLNLEKPISIYDTLRGLKYEIVAEFSKRGSALKTIFKLANAEGKTLLTLSSEGISQVPSLKYSIIENDVKIGGIIGKKLFTHSEFNMNFNNEEFRLYGSKKILFFFEIGFEITKGNYRIAKTTKKWYKNTYQIEINEKNETIPIICLVSLLSYLLNIRQRL